MRRSLYFRSILFEIFGQILMYQFQLFYFCLLYTSQKDSSWGDYTVTTLHDYAPVILKNALIYSDNIYFAKAALKIGADQLMQSLNQIGFNQELPFDIKMSESQYSNTDKIETEIQLADSGYGQGQILVNPLHRASIYTCLLYTSRCV